MKRAPQSIEELCPARYIDGTGEVKLDCVLARDHKDEHASSERKSETTGQIVSHLWHAGGGIWYTANIREGDPETTSSHARKLCRLIEHGTRLREKAKA